MINYDSRTIQLPHRRTFEQRDLLEILRMRADLLAGEDRTLMQMYLDSGHSFRQLARLTGSSPSTIARRIRRIAERLTDETYFGCLRRRRRFRGRELAIIRDHFVRGLSLVHISQSRNISYYTIRRTISKARRIAARSP